MQIIIENLDGLIQQPQEKKKKITLSETAKRGRNCTHADGSQKAGRNLRLLNP